MTTAKEFKKGIDSEDLFEAKLEDYGLKGFVRNKLIKIDGISFKMDFVKHPFYIEMTHQIDNNHIQQLCFRGAKIKADEDWNDCVLIVIVPIDEINKRGMTMLSTSYDYIFDISNLDYVIHFINSYSKPNPDEDTLLDIAEKELNEEYIKYLKRLSKKNEMISIVIEKVQKIIYDNPIKECSVPSNLGEATLPNPNKTYLSEISKNTDIMLSKIFKNVDLSEKAKLLLDMIKKEGYLDSSKDVYTQLDITYSQYYNNLLKKLKNHGLIRKEGRFYRLDSKFSLMRIREASHWIEFAEIKRNQPRELSRVILSLFGLEDNVKR